MTPVGLHPADEDTERVKRNIEDKEQTSPNEYLHRGKDGTIYFVETHTQDIFYKGREAWITIIRDVTERKKAEHDLKTAFEKATESDRLKSAFLANMSHEIRTPMNGILGFADLLKEPGLTGEQQKKYIAIIENSGDRMLNTINNLIDISKVEAGQMEVSLSEVNVNEQI